MTEKSVDHGAADGSKVVSRLMANGFLSEDDAQSVQTELAERAKTASDVPGSALHLIRDRSYADMAEVMGFLHHDSGLPLIPATQFAPQKEAYERLGLDFMIRHGVLALDMLDDHVMVAVLDPYDADLKSLVKKTTGSPCLFYLVAPTDFDTVLSMVQEAR